MSYECGTAERPVPVDNETRNQSADIGSWSRGRGLLVARMIDANTAANRVIALALLADSQLGRAIHIAEDARAEARAREDSRRRREEADRAFREQQARSRWADYDARRHSAAVAVKSANNSMANRSLLAGVSTAVATLVGAFCCLTVWLVAPTTYLEADYFFGVYGIGESLSLFLWLPILLGAATWYVCRRVPAVSLLSIPAIGWIIYASGPAVTPPGSPGLIFSDFVESLGEWSVLATGVGAFGALGLIWMSKNVANDAYTARKKKTAAEARLREVEATKPSVPRPDVVR